MAVDRTVARVLAILEQGETAEEERQKDRAKERRAAFLALLGTEGFDAAQAQFVERFGEDGWRKEVRLLLKRRSTP